VGGAPSELLRQHHVGTLTRLPVPAQHGGQSKRGEREPNKPANQMRARLRQGLGALRLAFVVVSHVRSSKSRLRHCKPGRKKTSPEIGSRASSDRAIGVAKDFVSS